MSKYNEVMENVKVTDEMRKRILLNIEKEEKNNISEFAPEKSGKTSGNNIVSFIRRYGSIAAIFALLVVGTYGVIRTVGLGGASETATSVSEAPAAEGSFLHNAIDNARKNNKAETDEAMTEEATAVDEYDMIEEAATESAEMEAATTESACEDMEEAEEESAYEETALPETSAGSTDNSVASKGNAISKESGGTSIGSAKELSEKLSLEFEEITSLKDKAITTSYYLYDEGGAIVYETSDDEISYCISTQKDFYGKGEAYSASYSDSKTVEALDKDVKLYGENNVYWLANWEENGIWYSIVSDKGLSEDEMIELITEN